MEIKYSELDDHIRLIKLSGELDSFGVGEIETKFSGYCAGENPLVVVDLSEVDLLASTGIRLLMSHAKSIASRGGRMILLNPTKTVMNILEVTGIPATIPIYDGFESAQAVLLANKV